MTRAQHLNNYCIEISKHYREIDRLYRELADECYKAGYIDGYLKCKEEGPQRRQRPRWIKQENGDIICSECGHRVSQYRMYPLYCPNCGKGMEG